MSKTIQQRGVGTRHDPSLIRRLLSERQESGETYIDLETRSGIPASTFASCVRRSARDSSKLSAFVEVEVAEAPPQAARVDERGESFEILIEAPHGDRRLLVPPRFDPADLQRVVRALEESC